MSDTKNNYGRDGDLDREVAEILAECERDSSSSGSSEDIREMARRYGVDVGGGSMDPRYEPSQSDATYYMPPYYPPRQDVSMPHEQYDKNGGRIVYDADAPMQGRVYPYSVPYERTARPEPSAGSIPSASQRRKNREQNAQSSSVHVLYDADTSAKTAYEAPFENIGDKKDEPAVSDGIEKNRKKKTKKVKEPKTDANGLSKTQRFFRVFIPWNGDSQREKVRKIVMDVSFFVLFFCAIYFMNYFIELSDALNIKDDMQNLVVENQTDDLSARWAQIRAKYPDVNFPEGMNIDYAELYARNQDFVGWISIDNTNVDTMIVQADDNSYYLKHDFLKRDTKYGNVFMDYRNNNKDLDQNTILYGHHMRDNLMFAQLENYMTIDGFKASPVIEFNTAYQNYQWKVYAVFVTNDSREDDNGYLFNYIVPNFYTEESFASYIEAMDERKLYDTGVDINTSDKILTLSTCSYEFSDARLVVVARMVRPGESAEVDVSKAVVNENPRYPQIWYDEHGQSNPYRDAPRWEPNQ